MDTIGQLSMKQLEKQIETLILEASETIDAVTEQNQLNQSKVAYLGKKGQITQLLKQLKQLDETERPVIGNLIHQAKQTIMQLLTTKQNILAEEEINAQLTNETIDVSLPGLKPHKGGLHPITHTINRIKQYFSRLGFETLTGPEIESSYYNFEALNIPEHHPARAMHDTFYFDENYLLRTHTSPVQIRTMIERKKEDCLINNKLAIICPGKVYRCDSDQTHSPMFHQIEGLYLSEKVTFSNLKTTITAFLRYFFEDEQLAIRFRPSYFPFTEPSAEVDIAWQKSAKDSSNANQWLEVLGCGLVHPTVLINCGIDPNKYSGFAFGLGVERFAMLRYQVPDLRIFFENDLCFLEQFN